MSIFSSYYLSTILKFRGLEEPQGSGVDPHSPQTKQRRGHKPVLGGDELVAILNWLEDNPTLTLKQIVVCIKSELNKKVSKSTIKCTLKSPIWRWS
jgi:transposase